MNLVWCTDVHLNFLGQPFGPKNFGKLVREENSDLDAVVITGDIGEFPNFLPLIESFAEGVEVPVWFVLGNHDGYGGSVKGMRAKAQAHDGKAMWLPKVGLVELAPGTALVGHDGWFDARFGEPTRSNVVMSDFVHVKEFLGHWGNGLIAVARQLGDQSAEEARGLLKAAIEKGYKRILFATHVPPYAQATWHRGEMSNAHWLPWMSSRAMGEVLDEVSGENPDVSFTVLCGHTHSAGTYKRSENLTVHTGHSEYGHPRVCGKFTF